MGYWFDEAAKGEHLLVTRRGKPLITVRSAKPPRLPFASQPLSPPPAQQEDRVTAV
jgi:hypothetical protein